jgi:hypothetical protein
MEFVVASFASTEIGEDCESSSEFDDRFHADRVAKRSSSTGIAKSSRDNLVSGGADGSIVAEGVTAVVAADTTALTVFNFRDQRKDMFLFS